MKSRPHESLGCRCHACREFDGALGVEIEEPVPESWPDDQDLLPDEEQTEPAASGT